MSRTEFSEKIRVKRLHHAEFKCEGIVTRDDVEKALSTPSRRKAS